MFEQIDAESFVYFSSIGMVSVALVAFVVEIFGLSVPYGRYSQSQGKGWGFKIPARTAWVLMESPTLYTMGFMLLKGAEECTKSKVNIILILMFVVHYINRSLIFPFRMAEGAPMPVTVMLLAFFYCFWNGCTQGVFLALVKSYPESWLSDPRFIIGSIMFVSGLVLNVHADSVLLNLRAQKEQEKASKSMAPGAGGYKIPYGGLFEYVSCANYSGEIMEWTGFAIACWSLPGLAFAVMTFSNLAPRAHQHHKWYLQKFDNYPKHRKAVIPFVW